jgi:hypothetical protein
MSLVLQSSGGGSVTIAEPTTASNFTQDLPAVNGTILTSASQSIPKAALPTGSVLQVVNAKFNTETSTSTNTYVDTGLTATITPLFASSKILVLIDQGGLRKGTDNALASVSVRALRGATLLGEFALYAALTTNTNDNIVASASACYLDSPNTTTATTYKTQLNSPFNAGTAAVQNNGTDSTITLLEIAA